LREEPRGEGGEDGGLGGEREEMAAIHAGDYSRVRKNPAGGLGSETFYGSGGITQF
jgi:hypothetical protein